MAQDGSTAASTLARFTPGTGYGTAASPNSHYGPDVKPNTRRDRTEAYKRARANIIVNLYAKDIIEEYHFTRLVRAGIIVREPIKMKLYEAPKPLIL